MKHSKDDKKKAKEKVLDEIEQWAIGEQGKSFGKKKLEEDEDDLLAQKAPGLTIVIGG